MTNLVPHDSNRLFLLFSGDAEPTTVTNNRPMLLGDPQEEFIFHGSDPTVFRNPGGKLASSSETTTDDGAVHT